MAIGPVQLVVVGIGIGLLSADEAAQHHEMETKAAPVTT